MMSVKDARWSFYECIEAEDCENAPSYFETLFYHYQQRGKRIKELNKQLKRGRLSPGVDPKGEKNSLSGGS